MCWGYSKKLLTSWNIIHRPMMLHIDFPNSQIWVDLAMYVRPPGRLSMFICYGAIQTNFLGGGLGHNIVDFAVALWFANYKPIYAWG